MSTILNMDVIKHILSYNDALRILKIKMNEQNMKYLFENIKELYTYLWCMKDFLDFSDYIEENIYVDIIKLLSDKNYTMKEIKNHILSLHNEDCFEYFIDIIINNYHTYYLNDEYYYNGYWWYKYWAKSKGKKFYDGYPRMAKTKMNEQNIKQIFENNSEIYDYLRCMEKHSSFPPNIEKQIYIDIIYYMSNKNYKMEKLENHILSYPQYIEHLLNPEYDYRFNVRNENWLKYFIHLIINNYHTYYLNDNYYDNGYWYDNEWIKDDGKQFYYVYRNSFTL